MNRDWYSSGIRLLDHIADVRVKKTSGIDIIEVAETLYKEVVPQPKQPGIDIVKVAEELYRPREKTAAGLSHILRAMSSLRKKNLPIPAGLIKRRDVNLISGAQRLPVNNDLDSVVKAYSSIRTPFSDTQNIKKTINNVSMEASKRPLGNLSQQNLRMLKIRQTLQNIGKDFAAIRQKARELRPVSAVYTYAKPTAQNILHFEGQKKLVPKGVNVKTPLFPKPSTTNAMGWYDLAKRTVNFPLLKWLKSVDNSDSHRAYAGYVASHEVGHAVDPLLQYEQSLLHTMSKYSPFVRAMRKSVNKNYYGTLSNRFEAFADVYAGQMLQGSKGQPLPEFIRNNMNDYGLKMVGKKLPDNYVFSVDQPTSVGNVERNFETLGIPSNADAMRTLRRDAVKYHNSIPARLHRLWLKTFGLNRPLPLPSPKK